MHAHAHTLLYFTSSLPVPGSSSSQPPCDTSHPPGQGMLSNLELKALNSDQVGLMAGGWATDNNRDLSFFACSILIPAMYAVHEVYA